MEDPHTGINLHPDEDLEENLKELGPLLNVFLALFRVFTFC